MSTKETKKGALELVEFAKPPVNVIQTPQGEFYTQYAVNVHSAGMVRELQPTSSTEFRQYLQKGFMDAQNTLLAKPTIETAIGYLEANARYNGQPSTEVFVRVAPFNGGEKIYVDLADPARTIIEITKDGWDIATGDTPLFYRPKSMRALPLPTRGGNIKDLKKFLALRDEHEEAWATCMAWAIATFHPTGPYPILAVYGGHGALKSSVCRCLKLLTDPGHPLLGGQPKDAEIVNIRARHSHVLTFDNLSSLPDWLSDLMCRLSTGAGDTTRKFYENTGEVIFEAKRPVIYNSIEEIARRADLLDRSYMAILPGIPKSERRDETTIQQEFEEARPELLGALYDAVSSAIQNLPTVDRSNLSRMADAELWTRASESCYTVKGTFTKAHENHEVAAVMIELESSLVAKGIREYVQQLQAFGQHEWKGLAEDLYGKVEMVIGDKAKGTNWPKSANHFMQKVNRHAPNLRKIGIDVTSSHTKHGTQVQIDCPIDSKQHDGKKEEKDENLSSLPSSPAASEAPSLPLPLPSSLPSSPFLPSSLPSSAALPSSLSSSVPVQGEQGGKRLQSNDDGNDGNDGKSAYSDYIPTSSVLNGSQEMKKPTRITKEEIRRMMDEAVATMDLGE